MDREVKRLKQSRIPIIKVRWNSRRGPEFTWEHEDFFRSKYPHLFARRRVTSVGTSLPKGGKTTLRGSCGKLDAQPTPPDEGVMVNLRSWVKSGPLNIKRDKEEQIKKAKEEARLLAINKPEDVEHEVLQRQHTEKVIKSLELRKHKYDSYMWIISSRLKPKPIIDIKIHLKTKLVVITVYRGTNDRSFDVHKPFLFGAFGISKLDELREIIPKKKNTLVKDLMNSLSRRYERLRQIPGELGIQSTLLAPEQAPSKTLGRKRKHMELEPETRILGLECNRALPRNVLFVNNMVIKEPEYGIFFIDKFGDQAFQRWSDIDKVGMEALVSYLVAASMVKSPENARFNMKMRKLITKHPDQEKLKSKKVKLEALGYKMD
ncbi:hypothetical protein Tco_0052849 [Tanacetum coccineum]